MAKRKKPKQAPYCPPTAWDAGAMGQANRLNLVTEDAGDQDPDTGKVVNPNGVKRMRRVDMIEVWFRRGIISAAGYNAARQLRNAFEATQRAPGWPDNDRVQSSPKPDHAVTIQIDRLSRYAAVAKHVHPLDKNIIDACVIRSSPPRFVYPYLTGRRHHEGLALLAQALDRVANSLVRRK